MNKILLPVVMLIIIIFGAYLFTTSNQKTTQDNFSLDQLTIKSTEVREVTDGSSEGDVYATLSNGEVRLIAQSDPITQPPNFANFDMYRGAAVSPNNLYVAIGGIGFEESFVQVYDVQTDTLHEKIDGGEYSWTDEGLLKVKICSPVSDGCSEFISVSSQTPWEVKIVPGTEIVRDPVVDEYRDTTSATTDSLLNINNVPNLSEFAAILNRVGSDAIKGTGPFTVFAPTNKALSGLSKSLSDEELIEIVRMHVVANPYNYEELQRKTSLQTIGLDTVTIKTIAGSVQLNDSAYIIEADIVSSNGIIQVIDGML
jgi:uncharacterized surface protein with fasciclin (FAS1) repeats